MKILKLVAALGVLFVLIVLGANIFILNRRYTIVQTVDAAPTTTLALVFGGGMNADGSMGTMQTDRVKVAIELYKRGKAEQIMMTGDDGWLHADEVDAMRQYAIDAGVPSTTILVDRHGYRTYESCYREAKVYGVTKALMISQNFHLPRIIYLCNNFGIESVGLAADLRDYGIDNVIMQIREAGARLKAVWQVMVTKPAPQVLQ
jgi:vancomycin permeability regulator SanA